MAEVRLRMLGTPLPTIFALVQTRSNHRLVPEVRLGRRNPDTLQDLGACVHLVILRHLLCHGAFTPQLGAHRVVRRRPRSLLPRVVAGVPNLWVTPC